MMNENYNRPKPIEPSEVGLAGADLREVDLMGGDLSNADLR
ncbi:MAG: pentapeptide repeat-containing protein, partial [Gammaproteobacteria bacterium]|nr:pentapeptide repeat-containing protein [Gammaproteobacteria bacterium]MYK43889.1 pentapeptide repeat-containing protein [Gammaproteobacteria bacterium]